MAYLPKGLSTDADSFTVKAFYGGINTIKAEHDIADSQAASCYNVYNAEIMGLDSRYGYSRYYATALFTATLNALFTYSEFATTTFLFAASGILYKDLTSAATAVYTGIGTGTIRTFEMEGNVYMLDGSGYLVYNTSGATGVNPYIPTYWIDGNPDGTGGGQLDELNFLTSAFIQTFNGNGYTTAFYMQFGSLTTGNNIVIVNGVTQTSGAATAGYTVNYASGIFNLTTAATTAIGNVSIKAYKALLDATEITHCTMCVPYGIGNSVNAYLTGNSAHPARLYWSYLLDPTYFPATSYAEIGIQNDKNMGLLGHANSLLIFKYDSVHAWNGVPPENTVAEIYIGEGCIATDSLRLANGFPTLFSQRGVCILEKEGLGYVLTLISEDANGIPGIRSGMMTETLANRQNSYAWVMDKKYWLYLNNKIWIYQYNLTHTEDNRDIYPWIPWTSVANFNNFRNFAQKDHYLFFSGKGNFYKFDPLISNDDGAAISSYWLGKEFHVGESYDVIKSFDYQYWHLRAYANIATSIMTLSNMVSGVTNSKTFTMTPVTSTAFIEYSIRHPIHYKSNSIQYSVLESTVSGGFALQGTKIYYQAERRNIET